MITLPNVKGHPYAVLGLGKSGQSAAASLRASGAEVTVWDDDQKNRFDAKQLGYTVVDFAHIDVSRFKALILSPGIPHTYPKAHPAVMPFRSAMIPIIGDIELLFRACPHATYVGITGTNGKSTTTALIAHILEKAGRKVQVGGNLGMPVLSLAPLGVDGIYVLELSSYQLELMEQNLIKVAVLLNITPDHLDRHGGLKGYIAAKSRIISTGAPQTLIIGSDQRDMQLLFEQVRGQSHLRVEEISVQHAVSQGVMAAGQQMFLFNNEEGRPILAFPALTSLPGKHNWQNACAAFAACHALDVPTAQIIAGLKSFPGLVHRQQFIAELDGVRFVNDSKATNADAAGKALACYQNIYWIVGGQPKEGGLNGLESFVPQIRHAFLIGQATDAFAAWCDNKLHYTRCGTLDVATQKAATMAWHDKLPKAVVLLSPACASWDQFTSFEQRGEVFTKLVNALKATHTAITVP
jgi:UDP-N-acetylmuramoylalanine--D-glutamate ligase